MKRTYHSSNIKLKFKKIEFFERMRNYEKEIEHLRRDIEDLNLEKQDKETQLQRVLREQKRKNSEMRNTQTVDKLGRAIFIGNQVITTTA